MSAGDIGLDLADGMATLRLRNPARRNAMSTSMWRQLAAAAADLGARRDVRVVLIRGDGDQAFCAGADISGFDSARSGTGNARDYDDLVENTCLAIEAMPQPTLAVVIGACMGAGVSIAASCDLRLATEEAFFAVPAARLGLGYDPRGARRCVRVYGADATRELLFTADRLPATRLHALGAVSVLAPSAGIERAAIDFAARIAANAPLTVKAAKVAVRAHALHDDAILAQADALYAQADASEDYAEGRRAFAEKRKPRFTGA